MARVFLGNPCSLHKSFQQKQQTGCGGAWSNEEARWRTISPEAWGLFVVAANCENLMGECDFVTNLSECERVCFSSAGTALSLSWAAVYRKVCVRHIHRMMGAVGLNWWIHLRWKLLNDQINELEWTELFVNAPSNLTSPGSSLPLDLWTMGLDNEGSICSCLRGKKRKTHQVTDFRYESHHDQHKQRLRWQCYKTFI